MTEYRAAPVLLVLLAALASGTAFKIYLAEPVRDPHENTLSEQLSRERACMDSCFGKGGMELTRCRERCVLLTREPSTPAVKRQLMPLQSCLEAKCLGVSKKDYVGCMIRYCIYSKGLKGKRSWDDADRNCILFHCGGLDPGTLHYHACTSHHCGKKR